MQTTLTSVIIAPGETLKLKAKNNPKNMKKNEKMLEIIICNFCGKYTQWSTVQL